MCLSTDEYSDSLSQSSLKLLVQLIDTDSVNEVSDIIIVLFALENNCNVESDEDVIVSWASANWEFVDNVLLSYKELDLGPREAEDEATFLLNTIEFTMLCDYCISSFRPM